MNACCTGCGRPPGRDAASPSMVTIFCPATRDTGSEHDRTARLSTRTVQAPHCPSPQPKRGLFLAGAVNLSAPAPRAGGKPDLSGIWEAEDNRPCPAGGCLDMKVGQEFVNIGWSLKGGLPYQPWAAELTKQRTRDNRLNDPMSRCL